MLESVSSFYLAAILKYATFFKQHQHIEYQLYRPCCEIHMLVLTLDLIPHCKVTWEGCKYFSLEQPCWVCIDKWTEITYKLDICEVDAVTEWTALQRGSTCAIVQMLSQSKASRL